MKPTRLRSGFGRRVVLAANDCLLSCLDLPEPCCEMDVDHGKLEFHRSSEWRESQK